MEQLAIEQSLSAASDLTVFTLKGPLTLSTMFDFQSTLRNDALKGVVLDISGVPYMDSAGLGVLLAHFVHSQRVAMPFAVAGTSDRVRRLFEITHTDNVLPLYTTVAEAETALTAAQIR